MPMKPWEANMLLEQLGVVVDGKVSCEGTGG